MPKDSVEEWSKTASENTDIGGINIDEGCLAENLNNAQRENMAQIADWRDRVIPAGAVQAYIALTPPDSWYILNADTIGSAAAAATHNTDENQTLFELLWNNLADAQAPVVGGRGASANADWVANKAITLPDAMGRAIFGREVVQTRISTPIAKFNGGLMGDAGGDQRVQNHEHPQGGLDTIPAGDINTGGTTYARQATTGIPSTIEFGGNSANVPPGIIFNWIIKR